MDLEVLVTALRQQCEMQIANAAVRPYKGPAEMRVTLVHLSVVGANKTVKIGKLKVGWLVCPMNIHEPPEA